MRAPHGAAAQQGPQLLPMTHRDAPKVSGSPSGDGAAALGPGKGLLDRSLGICDFVQRGRHEK